MSERKRYSKRYNYLWDLPKVSNDYIDENSIVDLWREDIQLLEIAKRLKLPPIKVYQKMRELCLID